MASFNKIIIVGYLGRDPEIRYTADGTPVCSFTVATTEKKKDKSGELQDSTTWFRVTTWRRQAELANQYLSKGKQVYLEGKLSLQEFQDKDGNNRTSLEVTASEVHFLGSRGDEVGSSSNREYQTNQPTPRAAAPSMPENISDDDIPF